jgi:hypothetical protein
MSISLLFWLLWVLWIIGWFGVWQWRSQYEWAPHLHNFLLLILLFLLGWKVFGFILQG